MSEGVGNDPALRFLLDGIIPDRIGSAHCLFDVAFFQIVATVIGPDSGEVVSLQFESHGVLIVIGATPHRADFARSSEKILNVVTDLMSDHVGLGEIARSAERSRQFIVEFQIDVDRWLTNSQGMC